MRRPAGTGPVVVKVGSSTLTGGADTLDKAVVDRLSAELAAVAAERSVVLVSSGAVAAGLSPLGLQSRPAAIADLQAAAAVGQSRLMQAYTDAFGRNGTVVGQVLLTRSVLAERDQYLNARSTLLRLIELGVVPVVNENDTVATDELRVGDNDRLAAVVAHLVGAAMLVILTDTRGLYSGDPRFDERAELIDAVRHTDTLLDQIRGASGPVGSGGVATKVAAARMAAWSGIPTIVATGSTEGTVAAALAGDSVGTWVEPRPVGLAARKLWIAFGLPAMGTITVDQGAARAVVGRGSSLLSAGVVGATGDFAVGDAVEVMVDGRLIAKGVVAMDSALATSSAGRRSDEAGGLVIHRDDMVVLADPAE